MKKKWNEETIITAIDTFVLKNGRLPSALECKSENGLPTHVTIKKVFGITLYEFYEKYFPELKLSRSDLKRIREEEIVNTIKSFIQKNGRFPTRRDFRSENGLPSISTIKRAFNSSITDVYENYFPNTKRKINRAGEWDKKKIIFAIEMFLQKNGRLPTSVEFTTKNELPTFQTMKNFFGIALHDFYRIYFPNAYDERENRQWDEERISVAVNSFYQKNNRLPLQREFKSENGLPSKTTFRFYFENLSDFYDIYFPHIKSK